MLESLQDLILSWCKTVTYRRSKFGAWVSETYLATDYLNKWFYVPVDVMNSDNTFNKLFYQGVNINMPYVLFQGECNSYGLNPEWIPIVFVESIGSISLDCSFMQIVIAKELFGFFFEKL